MTNDFHEDQYAVDILNRAITDLPGDFEPRQVAFTLFACSIHFLVHA
jgi:hypothetical protein